MKSKYFFIVSAVMAGSLYSPINAQQLTNSDFEGEWLESKPWTSKGNEKSVTNGYTPEGWCISHAIGINGVGATVVGGKTEGYNSTSAVNLVNTPNPFMASQIVPAYLTLGTAWSTAKGIAAANKDGGTFGGVAFSGRPSGIEFMYKRSRGEAKPDETTTVVAYLWKGHWTQKDVPGDISLGAITNTDMTDRDRCVLGMDMTGLQGGEVTKSDDAELIAIINAEIKENTEDWTLFSAKFDYKSDATPEMFNIIIAAGDYFGGAAVVGKDNTLIVDNIKLIYDGSSSVNYSGYLNIDMAGSQLAENKPAEIQIVPTSEGKCKFVLPNFVLSLDGSDLALGDIVVNDVTVTETNGVTTYEGSEKGLTLMEGAIVADVTLNGTITGNDVNMKIDVIWNEIPINVTFTSSTSTSSIGVIASDETPAIYYNLQGLRVDSTTLNSGIYVKRQGNIVSKILVK